MNTVRELMGHKDITMTLRYAHLAPSYKQRAVDMLVEFFDTLLTPEQPLEVLRNDDVSQADDLKLVA